MTQHQGAARVAEGEDTFHRHRLGPVFLQHGGQLHVQHHQALMERGLGINLDDPMPQVHELAPPLLHDAIAHESAARIDPQDTQVALHRNNETGVQPL
ncbi:hypothetical protein STIAU_0177 [Stigmatella aurantiaca DW4/3-1]|uniref:Uncharacterized protein n=1 Tax=Stigmatella aurantiaca (strain DW4/3-1) TaxID=378806 RepID=Q08W68_STIAD|nr:hypothetical protein STIAU_0177 [Stigmatella aurantiaca DW4/3-1]